MRPIRDGPLTPYVLWLTLPRMKPGDARDRRGKAVVVERTPALPDLLYARGLPDPNRSLRDGASVRGGMLSTATASADRSVWTCGKRQWGGAIHPLAEDQGLSGPSL